MNTRDTKMGTVAVEIATQGENTNVGKQGIGLDWGEFWHFIGIWLATWLILLGALIIITIAKGGTDLIRDTVKTIDMLNLSFSLILSATLEQIWSKESAKNSFYKITLGCEICLTFFGGMLFMAYSLLEKTNPLWNNSFEINLGYAIASSIVVALGFFSRSLVKKD